MRLRVAILIGLTCGAGAAPAATAAICDDQPAFLNLSAPPPAPITFDGTTPPAAGTLRFDSSVGVILDVRQLAGQNDRPVTSGRKLLIGPAGARTQKPSGREPINESTEIATFMLIGTGLALLTLGQKFLRR